MTTWDQKKNSEGDNLSVKFTNPITHLPQQVKPTPTTLEWHRQKPITHTLTKVVSKDWGAGAPICPWSTVRRTRGFALQSVAYGDPHQNDQIFTHGGFSWIPVRCAVHKVYARRILVDPGPDPLDAWCLECFLFDPDVRKEDPVQWVTAGITPTAPPPPICHWSLQRMLLVGYKVDRHARTEQNFYSLTFVTVVPASSVVVLDDGRGFVGAQ